MSDRRKLQQQQEIQVLIKLIAATELFNELDPYERRPVLIAYFELLTEFFWTRLNALGLQEKVSADAPLIHLHCALNDLDRGHVEPLLEPRKVNCRPPGSSFRTWVRTCAAVAMDLLVEAGIRRPDAAKEVANKLFELRYFEQSHIQITAKNVESWRDQARSEKLRGHPMAETFWALRKDLSPARIMSPILAARAFLRRFPEILHTRSDVTPPVS